VVATEAFRQFAVCPRCASPAAHAGGNPFRCDTCGLVVFFNAASAVAAFIVRDDGLVLYTRRGKDPAAGRLGLPGGFVDFGETAEAAVRREVEEEVGLELASLEYLASFPNEYVYAGVTYHTLDLFFVAEARDPSRARALDAIASTSWLDPASVDPVEIAFESMRRARTAFLAHRGKRGPTTG
jgi:mutator protein MutT